jgi:dihydrofolate reductase
MHGASAPCAANRADRRSRIGGRCLEARSRGQDQRMGTLTIDLFSSLDGFGAADGWPGYYGKEGPELMAWLEQKLAEDHTLVMGATTYREMSQIVAAGDDPTFERMAEIPKIVFSTTLKPPLSWANTRIADDAVATLHELKSEGAHVRTMGSISLNAMLLREGLVDLLQIVVFPVVTAVSGLKPIFAGWPDLDLELVSTRTFDGRMQLFQYVPTLH